MKPKNNSPVLHRQLDRRKFLDNVTKATGATFLLGGPLVSFAENLVSVPKITVGEIIDAFTGEVAGAPFANTVDTLKAGNRDIEVTGIVTSMFATIEVINKAIAMKTNFIIAHEPTYYNHLDETNWLENDEVYRYKSNLLKQHQVAVWRNHDYIHRHQPDGVTTDVVDRLGWTNYHNAATGIAAIPATSLKSLIEHAKKQLGIETLRYIGDLSQTCRKVLLMPGAAGGRRQIQTMSKEQPDVLICGEISEWETAEYVRDARASGQQLSLVCWGILQAKKRDQHIWPVGYKKNFRVCR